MSEKTDIGWCDSAVNPVAGCQGCELWTPTLHACYAGIMTQKYAGKKGWPKSFLLPTEFPGRMAEAAKWKDLRGTVRRDKPWIPPEYPRLVFISDMGDALSKDISFEYLKREIVDVVSGWKHIGLWLTKRPSRMVEFSKWLKTRGAKWPAHLWPGTSITSQRTADGRIPHLLNVECGDAKRFVSAEPLLSPVDLRAVEFGKDTRQSVLTPTFMGRFDARVDWCIVGAASGTQLPDCGVDAIVSVAEQCQAAGIPPFVKQGFALKPGQQGRIPQHIWALKQFPSLP